MALRAIMLRHRIDEANRELAQLREQDTNFQTREAELEAAISEAKTEEESSTLDAAIDAFEQERSAHTAEVSKLEEKIRSLKADLAAEEEKTPPAQPAEGNTERKDETIIMNTRNIFANMELSRRSAIFAQQDVKDFLSNVRTCIKEKRNLTNAGLFVPTVFLGLIRENIMEYSKLYKHVFLRPLGGNGKATIMGNIPEAVWTECCAKINELTLGFNAVEVGCNKVAGFIPVCNSLIEDSDIDLAAEIIPALGQAIGLALDKAILYGTGVKMPLGIVTRLKQTAQPETYPAWARPWANLNTTNVITIDADTEGVELFREIVLASGAAKGKYSRGSKVWVMNETTYTTLIANAMSINAAGAIATGVNGTMPVVGGTIEVLNFIPDNVIIGGYFDLYLLAERSGMRVERSEEVRFLEDETVFKGKARYDGTPTIAEAFVAIGLNGVTPTAEMTFAADAANAA